LLLGSLAAYAFAFISIPRQTVWVSGLPFDDDDPWEATLFTNYLTIGRFALERYVPGLAAPFCDGLGTFLLRQFFMSIPKDLQDAATIDGCVTCALTTIVNAAGSTGARHAGRLQLPADNIQQ